jgi:hypothetical protein
LILTTSKDKLCFQPPPPPATKKRAGYGAATCKPNLGRLRWEEFKANLSYIHSETLSYKVK